MARDLPGMLLGVGNGGEGGLQKLRIVPVEGGERVEALFNPSSISRSRSITWNDEKQIRSEGDWSWQDVRQRFMAVEAETLTLTLLFDTYESRTPPSTLSQKVTSFAQTANPFATPDATPVTAFTARVAALAEVDEDLNTPPVCRLSWGAYEGFFIGVLTRLEQQFTMFLPDGTPVRATVACTFTEYLTRAHAGAGRTRGNGVKVHVTTKGETLQSIAAREYKNPALWRRIAVANDIVKPHKLTPGTQLTIPMLSR